MGFAPMYVGADNVLYSNASATTTAAGTPRLCIGSMEGVGMAAQNICMIVDPSPAPPGYTIPSSSSSHSSKWPLWATILLAVALPVVLLLASLLGIWQYHHRHGGQYKQAVGSTAKDPGSTTAHPDGGKDRHNGNNISNLVGRKSSVTDWLLRPLKLSAIRSNGSASSASASLTSTSHGGSAGTYAAASPVQTSSTHSSGMQQATPRDAVAHGSSKLDIESGIAPVPSLDKYGNSRAAAGVGQSAAVAAAAPQEAGNQSPANGATATADAAALAPDAGGFNQALQRISQAISNLTSDMHLRRIEAGLNADHDSSRTPSGGGSSRGGSSGAAGTNAPCRRSMDHRASLDQQGGTGQPYAGQQLPGWFDQRQQITRQQQGCTSQQCTPRQQQQPLTRRSKTQPYQPVTAAATATAASSQPVPGGISSKLSSFDHRSRRSSLDLRLAQQAARVSSQLRLLETIGQGTFGAVYRAIWQGMPVAVKVTLLAMHYEYNLLQLQRFSCKYACFGC